MNDTIVYALDFDGVICDSAIETGMSGWKAAGRIWNDMSEEVPPDMIDLFRQVRPIIETGYEAILTMRMLYLGASIETLYKGHADEFRNLMQHAQVDSEDLKKLFGETRDAWISGDKTDWTRQNPLYPGVAEKLIQFNKTGTWYVITTKQERFVKMILDASNIELPEDRIFGLDRNMGKPEILKILLTRHPGQTLRFVEDRLPTLLKVRQEPELTPVQLFLALWGYNSAEDKNLAIAHGFKHYRLDEFLS
ncbi:HAD family hydrolase [Methylococcus sp. EFPC2]|uniref:HAD family hydrolase n=1 Tax=Methylococcus sp. EFPC2 TaxID=2812648 RepID=UPI0019681483|nr:HAD family hydrolase [Methylococcus sp. EFPC2]QSA98419.1 HAD family hydrolase [Methylococcus sp. EFPC2]